RVGRYPSLCCPSPWYILPSNLLLSQRESDTTSSGGDAMQTTLRPTVLLVLLACVTIAGPVRAETVSCTPITSLPAVITVQGIYSLTGNLNIAMTTGDAIDIQTNNVLLDLNGWKLGGLAAGVGTTANGMHAAGRQNITIKHGTVRGFLIGIVLDNGAIAQ